MSHELRTPLNAILGFTQMLDRGIGGPLTPAHHRYLSGIVRSAEHLLTLVNDILDVARIRAGKLALRREVVSVTEVADAARLTASAIAAQRDVRLEVEIPEGLPPVLGDPVRMQQVLHNLLSNGLKFTPAGGLVRLTAAADDGFVRIDVRDTGIGIRRADFPRLFHDFERLEHGQSQQADGTGLGLSLTRHLVELQGGRIAVDSEVGVGSTFSVWLPQQTGRAAAAGT
jgi:signal transduction histidine kinase